MQKQEQALEQSPESGTRATSSTDHTAYRLTYSHRISNLLMTLGKGYYLHHQARVSELQ